MTTGILSTMFLTTLKRTVWTLPLAALWLVPATVVLLAYQVATKQAAAQAISSLPDDSQKVSRRSPNGAETRPTRVSDRQPGDVEKDLTRLAELQADADLLEITLDGQKASILHSIQFLSGRVSRYAVQDRIAVNDWQQSLQKVSDQLAQDQESYKRNKIKLTLLKYQIARESNVLGVSTDATAPLTEINRRLDRLEEKIDRLAGALSGKAGP
jgi:hypothetical protein